MATRSQEELVLKAPKAKSGALVPCNFKTQFWALAYEHVNPCRHDNDKTECGRAEVVEDRSQLVQDNWGHLRNSLPVVVPRTKHPEHSRVLAVLLVLMG